MGVRVREEAVEEKGSEGEKGWGRGEEEIRERLREKEERGEWRG